MSVKVLDVSYWQGTINFASVKKAGYEHIILRAGYGTTVDPNFYTYAQSCALNGIKIGIYWFCYSTTIAEVKKEAAKCIETIKNYDIDLPVFYDFEYDTVTKAKKKGVTLGKNECSKFTIEFCEAMKKVGYTPGYYANVDYYNNYFNDEVKGKGYAFWLAHYNSNQTMHNPPVKCDFFQYSESGKVSGINGSSVDLDVCYTEKYLDCRNIENTKSEKKSLTLKDVINSMIAVAKNEIGYLEKKTNAQLDNKTANAGYNNYTKYWRDIKPDYQAQPWCACFVSWVFMKAFGLETAKKLLKHWPYTYCPTLGNLFAKNANPKVGDIVIFYRNGEFAHTGIVISVNGDYFETIEGNASSASGITPNGGAVVQKGYYNSKLPGTKFCTPDYSIVANLNTSSNGSTNTSSKPSTPATSTGNQFIKNAQIHLNNFVGANLQVDGIAGPATKKAIRKALQLALNKDLDCSLHIDGIIGANTKGVMKRVNLKKGDRGYLVTFVEIAMLANNIDPKGVECPGSFGSGLESGVKCFQAKKGLVQDSIVGYNTLMALCS